MFISKIPDTETALTLIRLNYDVIELSDLRAIFERFIDIDYRQLVKEYSDRGYSEESKDRLALIFATMKSDDIPYAVASTDIRIAQLAVELHPFNTGAIINYRNRDGDDAVKLAEALARSSGKKELIEKGVLALADVCPSRIGSIAAIDERFKDILARSVNTAALVAQAIPAEALAIGKLSPQHAAELVKVFPDLRGRLQQHFKIES